MNWCWNYVTFQRGTSLITGVQGSRTDGVAPAAITTTPLAVSVGVSASIWKMISGRLKFETANSRTGILP
jgi:hypothetical protein